MENNKITVYIANQAIPEFNIFKGSKFYMKDNKVTNLSNGKIMPAYFNITNSYFTITDYAFPCKPNDHIVYSRNDYSSKHPYTGIVIDIDEQIITVQRDGTNKITDKIKHSQVKKVLKSYYFISSEGCIQKAIKGKNKNADAFRIKTGNMFDDQESARNKLYDLRGY